MKTKAWHCEGIENDGGSLRGQFVCLVILICLILSGSVSAQTNDDFSVEPSISSFAPCVGSSSLEVPATEESGVTWGPVTDGTTYVFLATGSISYGTGCSVSPDGISTPGFGGGTVFTCRGTSANGSTFVPESLVGKLNGSCALQLDSRGWFSAPSSGTLTLLVNDGVGAFGNNSCSWQVYLAPWTTTLVDAQGFQPQLNSGIASLLLPITNTVDASFQRVGALTDGASLVVLQFGPTWFDASGWTVTVSDPTNGTGAAQVGSLWHGSNTSLPTLPVTLADPDSASLTLGSCETAIFYCPPPSWAFGISNKTHAVQIQVWDQDDNLVTTVPFTLQKPPLVLVHGLFGTTTNWNGFATRATAAGFSADLFTADYGPLNTAGFDAIYAAVPEAIREAVTQQRTAGVAATRVDVVAHSMGTDATRWYMTPSGELPNNGDRSVNAVEPLLFKTPLIVASPRPQEDEFLRADNFGIGDIRRFVTLGGVYTGTSICWQGIKMVNKGISAGLEPWKENMKVWTVVEQVFNFQAIALNESGDPDDVGMALVDLAARTHPFPNGIAPQRSVALTALTPIAIPYAPIEGIAEGGSPLSGLQAELFQIFAIFFGGADPNDVQPPNSDMCVPSLSARNENPQNSERTFNGVNHWNLTDNDYLNTDFFGTFFGADEANYVQP